MCLRLHEIVEASDSVISFDTYLAVLIKKASAAGWLQAAEIADYKNFLASLAHFWLGRGPWPGQQATS